VQEHEREIKRMKEKTNDIVSKEEIEMLNQKINYMMQDDYIAGNNAPLKAEIK
jgi:hypothetical protein